METGEEGTAMAIATGTVMETEEEEQQETTCPLWRNLNMKTTKLMMSR